MKLASALVGLAAFGSIALFSTGSSAMPVGVPSQSQSQPNVEHVGYICDVWGRCWWRPYYGYYGVPAYSGTYFAPRYDGGWPYRRGWRRLSPQGAFRAGLAG
jgi:hypothetical protein